MAFSEFFHAFSSLLTGRSGVGKALLLIGLATCVYQVWRRWRTRQLLAKKFRGKVVLITGASSGLGEGTYLHSVQEWVLILYFLSRSHG